MTTDTDLANAALAMLGEMPITSIDDTGSKPARVCKQFVEAAKDEVLRLGRWNCATKRVALVEATPVPISGFEHKFTLPADLIRILEINGEQTEDSSEYFEREGNLLLINEPTVTLRYVARVAISECDPLLQEAMAVRLAGKVCVALTGSGEKTALMTQLFYKALAEARQVDSQETGSRENSGWSRIFGRSRLLLAKGFRRNPERLEDY